MHFLIEEMWARLREFGVLVAVWTHTSGKCLVMDLLQRVDLGHVLFHILVNDLDKHVECMVTTSIDDIKLLGILNLLDDSIAHFFLKVISTSWTRPIETWFNLLGINIKSCHWVQKVNCRASHMIRTWGMWLTTSSTIINSLNSLIKS